MKFPESDKTLPQYAVDPQRFRAQATGVGTTQSKSFATGSVRAMCVEASMTPEQRGRVPEAEGYPQRVVEEDVFVDSKY